MSEKLIYFGEEIKTVGNTVSGYLVRFGNPNDYDLEGDYFTRNTDFGRPLKDGQKFALNLYYHHGQDNVIGTKSIGTGFVKMDKYGLWYEAQIDMNDEYNKMILELAKRGKLGFSSGAAAHMVEREEKGISNEIKRWTMAEASLTPRPAESRNMASVKNLDELKEEKYSFRVPEEKAQPEDLSVGDYVQWMAYGTDVRGQIIEISRSRTLVGQPLGTEMTGTEENPVFKIRVYQKQPDGSYELTNATTVHRSSALTKIEKPYKEATICPYCGKEMIDGVCKMCKPKKDDGEEEDVMINPEDIFQDIEKEMLLESIESLNERLLEAVKVMIENPNMIDIDSLFMRYSEVGKQVIEQFMSNGIDMQKEMDNYFKKLPHKPVDVRDAEKTLREAMSLSRSEAKKLASVVWHSLCDAKDAEEQEIDEKIISEEVKSTEIDNNKSDLRQKLLKKAMLQMIEVN